MTEEFNENMILEINEGDKVKGTVQSIEEKHVVLQLDGAKYDGIIPISQLSSLRVENAEDVVKVGDEIEAYVTKIEDKEEDGHYILSKRKLDESESFETLQQKFENGETLEAEVKEAVKGGLVVDVGLRGFIPASLISTSYIEDFSDYVGKVLTLKIEELDQEKNRVILNHKVIEAEENKALKSERLQQLEVGAVVEGEVLRMTNFGAFVDIGDVDGLVHISQITHDHIDKVEDALSVGDKVKVKILSVDPENERVSLSIKAALPGPFETIDEKFKVGDVVEGEVMRLANFGAFVEIDKGLQGLVHISQISHDHIGNPSEVLEAGQKVKVKILDINKEEKRIGLSIKATEEQTEDFDTSYLNNQTITDEDAPTLGDVFGDKFKGLNL
ncbi:30S ribosomal protein S1 [Macrococcoides bohemicum]|uniref:30S ribosomal protein S1 n=1 Tax=Macrococcoides bohemicum TaxID=1903056 RepID=A0A328A7B3_9STAP|nr:30S ribosomal protein S1 [Macrococcus bohemicus]MBC9873304.1 30S ribosomal protein S1 [Macrococcus bohemicus]QYA43854.1 30S ribosomal protein S1 [Macrococcus bohemicus]RAK50433.1 30S ribosomal protein S1 [Macrococcus bohemicus]TDL40450.1 30S ribosomal protein S1 [Macrococcus bohemicus]